jgi:NADH-quinone oxidoreductase subunit C
MEKIIERLQASFQVSNVRKQREDLYFVTVGKEQAISAVTYLRDMEGFSHLVMITVADWIEKGIFELNYIVHNYDLHVDISICTYIDRENATMHSAHHLWAQAWTYQRELKEMYGIDFPGSPRVDENFLLEGWDNIPPMRREFDTLKYSEETYFPRPGRETHDPATYMKQKLYPDEQQ